MDISGILRLGEEYNIYYDYYKTICIDKIPDGYYLNDTNSKTIDKCNIKCKTCNNESNSNNLCLSCNIENGYYPILNDNSNINSFINCSNDSLSGYILDNFAYRPCYSTCKECIKIGDNNNHQCSKCIDNFYLNETNCYQNCLYYYYFDDSNIHHCTEDKKCPDNKNKLVDKKGECIDNCSKDDLYKYEYNNKCYSYNITNYTQSNTNDITKENIEKTQESEIHYINTYYVNENKILDENNDKIIEYMSNELNDSYIKKEELEEIKNGNDLLLIEKKN